LRRTQVVEFLGKTTHPWQKSDKGVAKKALDVATCIPNYHTRSSENLLSCRGKK